MVLLQWCGIVVGGGVRDVEVYNIDGVGVVGGAEVGVVVAVVTVVAVVVDGGRVCVDGCGVVI